MHCLKCKSDTVQGIPGIGKETAVKYLNNVKTNFIH